MIDLDRETNAWLIISTPNPFKTFFAIALFLRGIFNWFSPAHYAGGGHISILPHWMIDGYFNYLGVTGQEWRFVSPFRLPSPLKQVAYAMIASLRRVLSRSGRQPYCEGETALVIVRL